MHNYLVNNLPKDTVTHLHRVAQWIKKCVCSVFKPVVVAKDRGLLLRNELFSLECFSGNIVLRSVYSRKGSGNSQKNSKGSADCGFLHNLNIKIVPFNS